MRINYCLPSYTKFPSNGSINKCLAALSYFQGYFISNFLRTSSLYSFSFFSSFSFFLLPYFYFFNHSSQFLLFFTLFSFLFLFLIFLFFSSVPSFPLSSSFVLNPPFLFLPSPFSPSPYTCCLCYFFFLCFFRTYLSYSSPSSLATIRKSDNEFIPSRAKFAVKRGVAAGRSPHLVHYCTLSLWYALVSCRKVKKTLFS